MAEQQGTNTNVQDFIGALGAGVVEKKLALLLSQVAEGVINNGRGVKKGKITLTLTLQQVGSNQQVMVNHRIQHETPTLRGHKSEQDESATPMYVGRGGQMTEEAPREDLSGNGVFHLQHTK